MRRVVILVLAVLVAVLLGFRLSRTAEALSVTEPGPVRAALCRVLPDLAPWRRRHVIIRLLADPLVDVRLGAVAACGRIPREEGFDRRLLAMLQDGGEDPSVRTEAGRLLLRRTPPDAGAAAWLDAEAGKPGFRSRHPLLVAAHTAARTGRLEGKAGADLLAACLDDGDPASGPLRSWLLDRAPEELKPLRPELVRRLEAAAGREHRSFLLSLLRQVDGIMRGEDARDWAMEKVATGGDNECPVVEAEWAGEIRPNYQVEDHEGRTCLALGEGGGGSLGWMKKEDGSVDIGSATLFVDAPAKGRYRLWSRAWFDDKCGNSFGCRLSGAELGNSNDATDIFRRWRWIPLAPVVELAAGSHAVRLQAWEDGVWLDAFCLLPEPEGGPSETWKAKARWRPDQPVSVSFSTEWLAQPRGTEQRLTAWVRRGDPRLASGRLALRVPAPFRVQGSPERELRFEEGNPLCRTTWRLDLPAQGPAGEGVLSASFTGGANQEAEGAMVLGAAWGWLCSGPLEPASELHKALLATTRPDDDMLRASFRPLPAAAWDGFRRVDFEKGYGQLRDRWLYLCADIVVDREGDYTSLLTADDTATVYVDGRLAAAQKDAGPAEGRLLMEQVHLKAGRQRVFAKVHQGPEADPDGPDALRHTFNRCVFTWLLRVSRHEPAPGIRALESPLSEGAGT